MSENKHTPEPWVIGRPPPNGEQTIGDKNGLMVAVATTGYGVNSEANARRIVACVNACAGCATEVLETAPVGFFNSTYGHPKYLEEITKQRDELLAALERFMDSHEECTDFDGFTAQIVSMADYHQAQEAIASVKGEQG